MPLHTHSYVCEHETRRAFRYPTDFIFPRSHFSASQLILVAVLTVHTQLVRFNGIIV